MKRYIQKIKQKELISIGFALFFSGVFLVTVLDGNRFFEFFGLVLLLVASAAFGASINAKNSKK